MYMGMNNSNVIMQGFICVYSKEKGAIISPLIENTLFRTQIQYKRGSGSKKGRMGLANDVRMAGGHKGVEIGRAHV